jgi:hypothetical protein
VDLEREKRRLICFVVPYTRFCLGRRSRFVL